MPGCDLFITGAGGFVGRHVLARATAAGLDVQVSEGDLRRGGAVEAQVASARPRAVVHLAASRRTARANHWDAVVADLAMSTAVLAAAARFSTDAPVLFVGSAAQYGMGASRRLTEDDPTDPVSPYGAAKAILEAAVTAKPLVDGVRVICTRSFNHVGPGQGLDAPVAQWSRQVASAEREGGGVVTTGGLDVVRDFLDVRDVADAYLALVRSDAEGPINVCSGRATSLRTVASFLVDSATVPIGMARDPSLERALDPPHVVGDPGRLTRMTGWSPRITLEESLEDQLDEWRARAGAPTSRQSVAVARAER